MISLKRYLDRQIDEPATTSLEESVCPEFLKTYLACLAQICDSGAYACPDQAHDLERGLKHVIESLEHSPALNSVVASESTVREILQGWAKRVASHYDRKASDVRDLLLIMSRTVESLGNKDDRIARRIDHITEQLTSIATLDDVSRIRASVEASARELKDSLQKMTAEGKALTDHLRAEVFTYQAKLEKAQRTSSCDALTGLGTRHWVECRIQERIDSATQFSIALVDINRFHSVVETYGNLVGDLLLKEFAKELRSACRFTDVVGRWGNDEFILLLDEASDDIGPKLERLRSSICRRYHVPGRTGYVNVPLTVSIGLAEYRAGEDVQSILERADHDLSCGRNQLLQNTA